MRDNTILYFLFFLLTLVTYNLYKETQENKRLYKICVDQEDVIQLQSKAIDSQKIYINELKYRYDNISYGKGNLTYPSHKKENSPIH